MSNLNDIAILIGRKAASGGLECIKLTENADEAISLYKDLRAGGGKGFSHLALFRRGGLIKRASFDALQAATATAAATSRGKVKA